MVINTIQVQTLTNSKSSISGAIDSNWSNTTVITGDCNFTYTTESIKGVRVYTKKAVILTKYPRLTPETNRLIINGQIYTIIHVAPGAWNVVTCTGEDVC